MRVGLRLTLSARAAGLPVARATVYGVPGLQGAARGGPGTEGHCGAILGLGNILANGLCKI